MSSHWNLEFRCLHTRILKSKCLHTRILNLGCLHTKVLRFRCLHIRSIRFRCLHTRVLMLRCLHNGCKMRFISNITHFKLQTSPSNNLPIHFPLSFLLTFFSSISANLFSLFLFSPILQYLVWKTHRFFNC